MQITVELSEIALDHKEIFDRYIKASDVKVSELNFTNLYIWRDYYKFRYCILNDFLCILSVMDGNKPFGFFPLGDYAHKEDLKAALYNLKDYFDAMGWDYVLSRVSKEQIELLESLQLQMNVHEDRDNFDYIYSVNKLSTLSGKKLDGKRNHINKFKKLYTFEYEEISEATVPLCKEIVEKWCLERAALGQTDLAHERRANLDLLDNYSYLGVKGALIKVNQIPEAFTIGERINEDTVVIHVEKANTDIHGLYPLINQQFLANQWSDLQFVNREQDLGIEGLRKAKLSYHPVGFVEKYTVELC